MIIIIQKAGLTIEVDLQQVGLHLLLLLQVSQHTLEQLQINKQTNTNIRHLLLHLLFLLLLLLLHLELTVLFPVPLGPTISIELLSPCTAVRFSSSSRCLQQREEGDFTTRMLCPLSCHLAASNRQPSETDSSPFPAKKIIFAFASKTLLKKFKGQTLKVPVTFSYIFYFPNTFSSSLTSVSPQPN